MSYDPYQRNEPRFEAGEGVSAPGQQPSPQQRARSLPRETYLHDRDSYEDAHAAQHRPFPFLRGLAALIAFGGIIWSVYLWGVRTGIDTAVPLIQADSSPIRATPTDPGGMEVKYKDSMVLNNTGTVATPDSARIENLLPEDEQPMPPPVPPQIVVPPQNAGAPVPQPAPLASVAPPADLPPPPVTAPSVAQPAPVAPVADAQPAVSAPQASLEDLPELQAVPNPPVLDAPEASSDVVAAPALPPQDTSQTQAQAQAQEQTLAPPAEATSQSTAAQSVVSVSVKPVLAPPAATLKPPANAAVTASNAPLRKIVRPTPMGGYRVQLSSLRSPSLTAGEWARLKAKFPGELGGLSMSAVRAETAQGMFFKLQAGPLSAADARHVCSVLSQNHAGGCLVVRP